MWPSPFAYAYRQRGVFCLYRKSHVACEFGNPETYSKGQTMECFKL